MKGKPFIIAKFDGTDIVIWPIYKNDGKIWMHIRTP